MSKILKARFNFAKECKHSRQMKEEVETGKPEICGTLYVRKGLAAPATRSYAVKKECKGSFQFAETASGGEPEVCGTIYVKKDVLGAARSFTATVTPIDAATVEVEFKLAA